MFQFAEPGEPQKLPNNKNVFLHTARPGESDQISQCSDVRNVDEADLYGIT